MWCLNTVTWNHTVAAFVKAALDLHHYSRTTPPFHTSAASIASIIAALRRRKPGPAPLLEKERRGRGRPQSRVRRPALVATALLPVVAMSLSAEQAAAVVTTGRGSWFWENPLPQGNTFSALSCPSPQRCYAAGGGVVAAVRSGTVVILPAGGSY